MKKIIYLFVLFLAVSCTLRTAENPVNKAEGIPPDQISIGGILAEMMSADTLQKTVSDSKTSTYKNTITQLLTGLEQVKLERKELDETDLSGQWDELNDAVSRDIENLSIKDEEAWIALNDSLLKYTEEVRFADALEQITYNLAGRKYISEAQLKSYFYTRLYDRIYFNVFGSSSLQYEHTTGGIVRIAQDTDYPFDGRITLKVELQDKRYLDLYIRIPEWANSSSVTSKGVKYNVVPGQFTEIAKKWQNGDEVEIIIGMRPRLVERKSEKSSFAITYGSLFLSYLNSNNDQLVFEKNDDPIQYLRFVSPPGKMPTFTFSGIRDTTIILQPYFVDNQDFVMRTAWLQYN